jgi:hypothetical protein
MTKFNGLIQHSFALRLGDSHQPFDGNSTRRSVEERFALGPSDGAEFRIRALHELGDGGAEGIARHSPLVDAGLTTVRARPLDFLAHDRDRWECEPWPEALSWATPGADGDEQDCRRKWLRPRAFFAEFEEAYGRESESDFLVEESVSSAPDQAVARALLEAIAFRRSQLFGLATANRFVNLMLPNARLRHTSGGAGSKAKGRDLILQPLLSLVRDGRDRRQFRQMYSLAFFVIPVEREIGRARAMAMDEVMSNVNAGWSLAGTVSEAALPRYVISDSDPLRGYVTRLGATGARGLREPLGAPEGQSLRQVTETVAFGIAMRLTQGSSGEATRENVRHVGDDVVTSLGTARVSSAILVDAHLEREAIEEPIVHRDPPGSLGCLMSTLASDTRAPIWTKRTRRRYQLDRPLIDDVDYAIGLVPSNRCLLVANLTPDKPSRGESLLSRVAAVTYMTLGAATAIGTMRSIDRALEGLEHEDPCKIAEIDAEIATDLHEIYDLDIARETYRQLYSRLRDRIGITKDYKTLQDKMQTLYRSTSTFHDAREQRQLAWLTAAIVALSVLILIGTVIVALNG